MDDEDSSSMTLGAKIYVVDWEDQGMLGWSCHDGVVVNAGMLQE